MKFQSNFFSWLFALFYRNNEQEKFEKKRQNNSEMTKIKETIGD